MLPNEYAYKVAKALVWPELSPEFAATVINGEALESTIWDDVCTLIGGWAVSYTHLTLPTIYSV